MADHVENQVNKGFEDEERIGVLLIHGIGQQGRFEHLDAEVRNLASAIASQARKKNDRVTLEVNTGSSCSFSSPQESWCSDSGPTLNIVVGNEKSRKIISFHEVWWSDLGESASVWNQIKFWFWGLSFWSVAGCEKKDISCSGIEQMEMPERNVGTHSWDRIRHFSWDRIRLFCIGVILATATASIGLVNFLAKRIGLRNLPGSRTIVSYIGDVKLYRQPGPSRHGAINNIEQPPRVAIRRRMICAVADMATADYSRWYILGHSLGSVVAFNALMETAHFLPNYLDRARLEDLKKNDMAGPGRPEDYANEPPPTTDCMLPPRPAWLSDNEVVYRHRLFEGLRGFVTYGSPLDKYATLWPALVPINRVKAFQENFEWVNLYDPTDPIAGHLDCFNYQPKIPDGGDLKGLVPINQGYKALWVLLLSHLRYLKCRNTRPYEPIAPKSIKERIVNTCLMLREKINNFFGYKEHERAGNAIAEWIIEGDEFKSSGRRWIAESGGRTRKKLRYVQWILAAFFVGLFTLFTIGVISRIFTLEWIGIAWLNQLLRFTRDLLDNILTQSVVDGAISISNVCSASSIMSILNECAFPSLSDMIKIFGGVFFLYVIGGIIVGGIGCINRIFIAIKGFFSPKIPLEPEAGVTGS